LSDQARRRGCSCLERRARAASGALPKGMIAKTMNVLVAGGAGYIGSVAVKRLLKAGHRAAVLDNLSKGHRGAVPAGAELFQGDIADADLVGRICRERAIDAAFHFAALTEVGESVADPGRYWENNFVAAKRFADALLEGGVKRLVFSSTAAVYGEPERLPLDENHPTRPTSPYGESKLAFEQLLRAYARAKGLRAIAPRYFNAAGAEGEIGEDHRPESHLIPILLEAVQGKRESVAVFGDDWPTPDGTCVRDYVHVGDIAGAHLLALERLAAADGPLFEAFNLGNGAGYSVKQVIEAVRNATGHPIPARMAPRRAGDPAILVASSDKARRELGWRPEKPGLDEIVASAWEWRRAYPEGYRDC
jgi:UDP-glucose 4-epimerase